MPKRPYRKPPPPNPQYTPEQGREAYENHPYKEHLRFVDGVVYFQASDGEWCARNRLSDITDGIPIQAPIHKHLNTDEFFKALFAELMKQV